MAPDLVKKAFNSAAKCLLAWDNFWACLPAKLQDNQHIRVRREAGLADEFKQLVENICHVLSVSEGPFAGLRYPEAKAYGSALYPKLLGTYENELHPFFRGLPLREYEAVIDVGCAEGFYLIGLGRLIPDIPLIGIDTDPEALRLVKKMAGVNQVKAERLKLHQEFSPVKLVTNLPRRSLLICDCEGFEATVFSKDNLWLWRDSDLLIECHDFILPKITEDLAARLEASHLVTIVESVDADQKISIPRNENFRRARPEHRRRLLHEGRPTRMRWILAKARSG
jgi:hypothetical protein